MEQTGTDTERLSMTLEVANDLRWANRGISQEAYKKQLEEAIAEVMGQLHRERQTEVPEKLDIVTLDAT